MKLKTAFIYSIIMTFFCFNSFFGNVLKQNNNVANNIILAKQATDFSKKQSNLFSIEAIDIDFDEELHDETSKFSSKNNFILFDYNSKFIFLANCLSKSTSFSNYNIFIFYLNEANPLYLSNCQIII